MAEPAASVGVVAIGRNEGERLRRCLASIPAGLPVVYVDSGSTDGSVEAARASAANVVALDMATPFTAARARNEGWRALLAMQSGLSYIQFVDGDCELEPGWLDTATGYLESHPDIALACGRRRERFPSASVYNAMADSEWNTPIGEAEACGGDALIRREALLAVGGFDPAVMAGEEPEMCARLRAAGWRIFRLDAPMTIHDAAMFRLGQYWRRAIRSGYGYAQADRTARSTGAAPFRRQRLSALAWAGMVPLAALAALPLSPWAGGAVLALYPLQMARLSRRMGPRRAALTLLAKFAEATGILEAGLSRGSRSAIDYKG